MDIGKKIIDKLYYGPSFTFVDEITEVNDEGIVGSYTFKENESFYESHFPDMPVTPGVIMIESLGQIGVVCYFIYIMMTENDIEDFSNIKPVFTSCEIDFFKPVFPGEKVTVKSRKIYFRLKKLKCYAEMTNNKGEIVCKGHLSGIYLES